MGKSITASKICMQRSSSWGSKSKNENCEKRSQLGNKIVGLKKTSKKLSRRRLTGRAYKDILKSWAKVSNQPAGADEVMIERSLSPLKMQRLDCDSKKELSKNSSKTCTKPISVSHSKASRFSEYWVPVRLSNVQLEQYCAALLSKSKLLFSSPRNGSYNSLHELLVLERECCGHPYVVDLDNSLRRSLTKDLPISKRLSAEIEMSGKLQLLDKCLLYIKKQGLRVLIIFQPSAGPGKISAGDVLNNFVLQRFGEDSYACIGDRDVTGAKKQAVLESFNHRESKQFVFLLEQSACAPSIKLCSVDTVILFDSDWDPLNDLKALQKISLEFQELKVFRLYSIHTVEEKVLILAKQALATGSLKDMGRRTCHLLLTWGAFHIFDKLDQFHAQNVSDQIPHLANESCFSDDVASEFSALLLNNSEDRDLESEIILKVQQSNGTYINNGSLYGELVSDLTESISLIEKMMQNESTVVFWKNLIEERCPKWRFLSNASHIDQTEQAEKRPEETKSIEKAAKRTCCIKNSASIQLKSVQKRKKSCIGTQKKKTSSALGFIDCKETKMQEINDKKKASSKKRGRPSKTLAEYIPERKKHKSLQDRDGKETALNRKEEFPLKTTKPNCIPKRVGKNGSSSGKQSQSDRAEGQIIKNLPASQLISDSLTKNVEQKFPAQSSKGEQKQIRTDHHSTLSGQEERDLEITMQKVVEQALKIKQDKKLQLQADANKAYSKMPINFVARPVTSNYSASPPFANQIMPTNKPKTVHLGNLIPAIGVRAMAPHLRNTCPASLQHLSDTTSKTNPKSLSASGETAEASSLSTPFLPYPAVPSPRSLGPTYLPVFGVQDQVPNHKGLPLPAKVSPPCYSQAQNGRDGSHLTTSTKPASGYSKMPIKFVARPVTSNYSASPPLSNQIIPTNKPKTVHLGNLIPAIGVHAMAPHFRRTSPASLQHLNDTTSKNSHSASGVAVKASSLSTPVLRYPAGPSSRPLGPTYQPVFGIQTPVPNHKYSPLPAKVSLPCYSQAQNGSNVSHLTTSPKPASGITSEKTLCDTEKDTDIASLSTSYLLSQFVTRIKKK